MAKEGSRKIGRNKAWCEAYRRRRQQEKNKQWRLKRHLVRFSDDRVAAEALKWAKAHATA